MIRPPISVGFAIMNVFRKNRLVWIFCIPVTCVPPGRTSPYQKGIAPLDQPDSAKAGWRQAAIGFEASAVPGSQLQVALLGIRVVWAESEPMPRRHNVTRHEKT